MSTFAVLLGRAFQLSDDLIDWHDDAAERHDSERENIACEIKQSISDAKHALASEFGSGTSVKLLCHLADYVMNAKKTFQSRSGGEIDTAVSLFFVQV